MASAGAKNDTGAEYPALPSASNGTGNSNALVAGTDRQTSADGGNVADASAPGNAGQATGQAQNVGENGRHVSIAALGPSSKKTKKEQLEEQQYEIERIIRDGVDDALSQFYCATELEKSETWRGLSALVHPDRQPDEWKARATEAQSILNSAREKYKLPSAIPEEVIPKAHSGHNRFWRPDPFIASVRRLKLQPENQLAANHFQEWNQDIEEYNKEKGHTTGSGQFPVQYFQDSYGRIRRIKKEYDKSDDTEYRERLSDLFKDLCVAMREYCEEHKLPVKWAWEDIDVALQPEWYMEELRKSEDYQYRSPAVGDDSSSEGDSSVDEQGAEPGAGQSGGAVHAANDTDGIMDLTHDLALLTLDGEPLTHKRKMFKDFQYLVEESSGLHVWKSAQLADDLKPEHVPDVDRADKAFIAAHKNSYKGIRWIAMAVDDAITAGAGNYPKITAMVEWFGSREDSLLYRSDLLRVAGPARVERDLQAHMRYQKVITFENRNVVIMSQTEAGLMNGEMKAMQRIKGEQFKVAKAMQSSYITQAAMQSGGFQPAVTGNMPFSTGQAGLSQAAFAPPAYTPGAATGVPFFPGLAAKGPSNAGAGFQQPFQYQGPQPTVTQNPGSLAAAPQTNPSQAMRAQTGSQPAAAQSIPTMSTQSQMVPESEVQNIVDRAVHRAVQAALQQWQQSRGQMQGALPAGA